jgi:hypothetical protein
MTMYAKNAIIRLSLTLALVAGLATALRADEDAAAATFHSARANDAMRKFLTARKKLDDTYEKHRGENRGALIEKLKEQVKAATKSGNLDEALAIREAIKVFSDSPADTPEEKTPPVAARPRTPTKRELLEQVRGSWNVSVRGIPGEVWTFNRDNTVVISGSGTGHGKWTLEKNRVYITWLHRANGWDTLKFPLDQMPVAGDSWAGIDILRAVKTGEAADRPKRGPTSQKRYQSKR